VGEGAEARGRKPGVVVLTHAGPTADTLHQVTTVRVSFPPVSRL
jgi:hypothetical protein